MGGDDGLRAHKGARAARQNDDGVHRLRHPHDAQPVMVPVVEDGRRVEHLVFQVGERVAGVNDLGREQGPDAAAVHAAHVVPVLPLELFIGDVLHAPLRQRRGHLGVHAVPAADHGLHGRVDHGKLLGGRAAALVVQGIRRHQVQVHQAAHPHHEKLVQVAGEDGQKPQPLHEGHRLVRRLLQHPLVKLQPAQLPVLGIAQIPLSNILRHKYPSLTP